MNDIRFPGLRGAVLIPPPSETAGAGRKATPAEPVPFDRAMERSVNAGQRADERMRERSVERVAERAPERSNERSNERTDERNIERRAERNTDRTPERSRAPDRGADDARRADDTARAQRRDTDRWQAQAAAERRDAAPAAAAPGTVDADTNAQPPGDAEAIADADANAVAQHATAAANTLPAADATAGADATIALLAASAALSGTKTVMAAAEEPTTDAEPADGDSSAQRSDGVALRSPAVRPDPAAALIAKMPKAADAATEPAAPGKARPGVLPELTADLTRTPAKDRLLEDFERRFESSLARAAGASGQSPLNALSPLASAGLPAGMQAPGSTLPVAQATVSTPIGHPAFAADLSHRVLLFAGQRVQSAQITVTPNDLGPISVSIEMNGQEAAIQFSAAHATTRAAIEDAMPRLREMLAAQGLQLTQADVGDHAQRDAHAAYGDRQANRGSGTSGNAGGSAAGTPVDVERSTLRRIGLIDIRV